LQRRCQGRRRRRRSAYGGDADASNNATVGQSNTGSGYPGSGSEQENVSHVYQGDNTATGGNATANGGDGGDADTGNTQAGNGNAWAAITALVKPSLPIG
jgi:hypothetical protein